MQTDTLKSDIRTLLAHVEEAKGKLQAYLAADNEQAKSDAAAAIVKLQAAMKDAKSSIDNAFKDTLG
ncbi:MAG: hypothetical protein JO199_04995 [Candidatus Eremiobacteraeota bacterium]|nr:hypothetical protein [Candidatus Eremiobacteraeota bacterium]